MWVILPAWDLKSQANRDVLAGKVLAVRVRCHSWMISLSLWNSLWSLRTINSKVPGKCQTRASLWNKITEIILTLQHAFLKLMSCHFSCQSSPSRYYYPIKESQDTCSHTNMNAQIYTRPSMLSALNSYRDNRKNAIDLADRCSFGGGGF